MKRGSLKSMTESASTRRNPYTFVGRRLHFVTSLRPRDFIGQSRFARVRRPEEAAVDGAMHVIDMARGSTPATARRKHASADAKFSTSIVSQHRPNNLLSNERDLRIALHGT
jgi:hypothetical protein